MEFQSKIFHYILALGIFKTSEPGEEIQRPEVQDDKYVLVEMLIGEVKLRQIYCPLKCDHELVRALGWNCLLLFLEVNL